MVVIKDLFLENRFPSGWKVIPLMIYTPLGIALATVRLFIGLQAVIASSLLHKVPSIRLFVLRIMCAILGTFVIQENKEARDDSVKVIVTNHVSLFDHLAVHLITGSISISVWDLPSFFHSAFNYRNLGTLKDKQILVQNLKHSVDNGIIVDIQPENAITSGQKGLLRFSTWPCDLAQYIQPISIKIWRPSLMEITPSVLSASWSSDLFWSLFVPFTLYTLKYLPVVRQLDEENSEDMSKRLQSVIAKDLKISVTNFPAADKAEYEKRRAMEKGAAKPVPEYSRPDGGLMDMALKVKEVLPDVPLKTICAELGKTKNVDVTIANFLEGLVTYVPEKYTHSAKENPTAILEKRKSSQETAQPSTSWGETAKPFPKLARDRMISFQERKMKLIESARQRYIEKHALNIMNSS